MLDSGSLTLLRAIFKRTIPLVVIQLAITTLFCLLVGDMDISLGNTGMLDRGDVRTLVPMGGEELLISILLIAVNAFFAIGTLLLQYSDASRLRSGLPMHVYLLPMTFRRIATLHMVYGLVTIAAVTWITTMLTARFLEDVFPVWQPPALATAIYALMQGWAFVYGGRRNSATGIVALVSGCVALVFGLRNEFIVTTVSQMSPFIGALGALLFAAVILELAIRLGRTNRFSSFESESGSSSNTKVKARKPFSSPYWTQAWYEWRNTGWILPGLVIAILTLYFGVVPLFTGLFVASTDARDPLGEGFGARFAMQWVHNQQIIVTGMLSSAGGAGVLAGAYLFLVSGEWRQKSTFLRTRPITTDQLAWVRLTVLLFSTACTTAILMGVYGLLYLILKQIDPKLDYLLQLKIGFEHVPDVLVIAFFAGTLFVITWTGLWIVNASAGLGTIAILLLAGMLTTQVFINVTDIPGDHPIFYYISRAPIWLATMLWVTASLRMYQRARSERVIPRSARLWAGDLWLAYTIPFLYYGLGIRYHATILDENGNILHGVRVYDLNLVAPNGIPITHPVDWVLWAGLSLFPILPFVTLPYRLNVMRCD